MNHHTHIHVRTQAGKSTVRKKCTYSGPTDTEMWIPLRKAGRVNVSGAVLPSATSAVETLSTDQLRKG